MTQSGLIKSLIAASIAFAAFFAQAGELTVSAASSLTNAFKEVGQAYEAQHPDAKVLFNFGASDALVQQIAKGAPVDVFASADQEAMDKAQAQKLIAGALRRNFAGNALVVVVPADSTITLKSLDDLQQADLKRITLGNPASVPVGRYTKRALAARKLWPVLESKTIYAQNVRQALDYVARGEVDAGFVYATDAAVQKDKVRVALHVVLDVPLTYPVALVNGSAHTEDATRFVDFLLSSTGQAILAKYGFLKP